MWMCGLVCVHMCVWGCVNGRGMWECGCAHVHVRVLNTVIIVVIWIIKICNLWGRNYFLLNYSPPFQQTMEQLWAMKAMEHAEIHFNVSILVGRLKFCFWNGFLRNPDKFHPGIFSLSYIFLGEMFPRYNFGSRYNYDYRFLILSSSLSHHCHYQYQASSSSSVINYHQSSSSIIFYLLLPTRFTGWVPKLSVLT